MVDSKLISILKCPKCNGSIAKHKTNLICKSCSLVYDVRKNIPFLFYAKNAPLQAKVRAMFNQTPYGRVGTLSVLKKHKKITKADLAEAPYHIHFNVKGKNVLDAGCGGGNLLTRLKLNGAYAYGLDQTPASLRYIKEGFEKYNLEPPILVEGNIEKIPFKDNTFDIVCSMGVLHHTQNPINGFEALTRVLKSKGTFYFMVYHKHSIWNYAKHILQFLCRRSKLFYNLIFKLTPHWMGTTMKQSDAQTVFNDNIVNAITKSYSVRDCKKICKHLNLDINEIKIFEIPSLYGLGEKIYNSKWLRWYEKRFGWLLYVEAVKRD
jgi:ubiquinone/menaquinone biosynthesis C-methylase UbiE/uncharacterized protein YbaR (Trm112 family)